MKEKILVYPFDRHFLPIMRYHFLPNEWVITHLVSPGGWGIDGNDAGSIDFGSPLHIEIEADFLACLSDCDGVFFTQSEKKIDFEKFLLPKILRSIEAGKNIYTNIELFKESYAQIKDLCSKNNVSFDYYSNNLDEYSINLNNSIALELSAPVISVMGLIEGLNKFETQVSLHKFLLEKGYNSLLLTSRSYGSLGKCYSVPSFMFSKKMSEPDKIIALKHFVKDLEIKTNPDVIILGVPGGLLPFDNINHNNFGITAFEITRAIKPDATLLCAYTENFSSEYWDYIRSICKFRFSSDLTACIRTNALLIFSGLGSPDESKFMIYDPKEKQYPLEETEFPIFEADHSLSAYDCVLNSLAENAESESF